LQWIVSCILCAAEAKPEFGNQVDLVIQAVAYHGHAMGLLYLRDRMGQYPCVHLAVSGNLISIAGSVNAHKAVRVDVQASFICMEHMNAR
jgi:hypothetical protein